MVRPMRLLPAITFFYFYLATLASADLFSAAGRIENVTGTGGCSASLIAADVIATAAHCVREGVDESYQFRLNGQSATVLVERVVVHPLFQQFEGQRFRRLRFDMAVARLATPVEPKVAKPFELAAKAELGEGLFLASWPNPRWERARERRCVVIDGGPPSVVTLGCRVRGGESGAPVLRLTESGMELVAIVNSTARQGSRSVAFASDVFERIPVLLERLLQNP